MMRVEHSAAGTQSSHHDAKKELLAQASTIDPLSLSARDARRLSKRIRLLASEPDVRVALAGNVVLDTLAEFVEAQLASSGLISSSYVAPYGQSAQDILNEASGLNAFKPHFLLLHFDSDVLVPFVRGSLEATRSTNQVEEIFSRVEAVARLALERTSATVLVSNFVGPDAYGMGLADYCLELSEQEMFAQLNRMLAEVFRNEPRVQIVDLSLLMAVHGRSRARDRRLYYVAKIPWHESFLPVLADELVRHVTVGLGRIRKCLVLDLDNTLWGGVLGEEGPLGVLVGNGHPVGEAHFDLQRRILSIKQRGILLAACSKNNPADVDELFRLRDEMPLRREDFVCMEIGWDMKHEGLRRIASQLNVGTDSLVFLDDNPAEIELIRQLMPEVQCVLLPADPALRPTCLDRVHGLDRTLITAEDRDKAHQYQQQAARGSTRHRFSDVNEYLHSLQTKISICRATRDMLPRAHQLFNKTNQFNVTTRRYSLAELQQTISDNSSQLIMIHVEDRFGDLGWTGAALLRNLITAEPHIDSFILSCRVMGRGIETAIINWLQTWCFDKADIVALTAAYLPTAKNTPVRDLFERHGFTTVSTAADGSKNFRLHRDAIHLLPCGWIRCEISMGAPP